MQFYISNFKILKNYRLYNLKINKNLKISAEKNIFELDDLWRCKKKVRKCTKKLIYKQPFIHSKSIKSKSFS